MKYSFKISKEHFDSLSDHLYPGDGKEAVSIVICGRSSERIFTSYMLIHIPHDVCERTEDFINWPTSLIADELPFLVQKNLAIFKIHSHPTGYDEFSNTDNKSDREFFRSIYGWYDNELVHGSIVMLPDGKMLGRIVDPTLKFIEIDKFSIIGRQLIINEKNGLDFDDELNLRNVQTLGKGTQKLLKNLSVGVVGCSGTGSPVIEQLARLGIGKLVLVDPDIVESKNLNRIINTKQDDAINGKYKVEVMKDFIDEIGFETCVSTYASNLYDDVEAINELATCDFIFGCVDSVDGRHLLNLISTFYLIPYIDVGIKILSDKKGGIDQISGTLHYINPGGSSLMTRSVYTDEMLRASIMYRIDNSEYKNLKKSGYIVDVDVEAPAVISINMLASSLAVNEFLSRIHSIKFDDLSNFDIIRFSLTDYYFLNEISEYPNDDFLRKFTGRGDMNPILNMPEFSYVE